MNTVPELPSKIIYLIYDGECILCKNTAKALQIKKAIGVLRIINARSNDPLVAEAIEHQYDLNEGILVKFNDKYYYGEDALNFLALIGSSSDLFNKLNVYLFSSKQLSKYFYSLFKILRKILLSMQNISPIRNNAQNSLVNMIYGDYARKLPKILYKRYNLMTYSKDNILLEGQMNITASKIFTWFIPLFRLVKMLSPYPGTDIPATVELSCDEQSNSIMMQRTLYYPDMIEPYQFNSKIIHIKDNIVIELIRFRLAAKLIYRIDGNKTIMDYGGYVFYIGKWLIPIPLGFIIGKISAFEEAETDESFNMEVQVMHPLFGKIFAYTGKFKIAQAND